MNKVKINRTRGSASNRSVLARLGKTRKGSAAGAYGRGLKAQFDRARAAASKHRHPLCDEHGAYTLVGKAYTIDHYGGGDWVTEEFPRRKWLAGISAQRGY